MKISKLAFIPLSTLLVFGCDIYSNSSTSDDTEVDAGTEDDTSSGQSVLLVDDDAADNDAELRVDLGGAYDTGTVSVNVMYASDEDQTAYITLYGESASSSYLIADVLMDESYKIDSDVGARLRDDAIYNDATLDEFSADTWTNISVDWDSINSEYSVTIGDEIYGPFEMSLTDDVEYIAFKIGSKSNITTSSTPLYLDDIIVTDGTSEIFSDDFESYTVDDDLAGTGSYSSSGYGATVSDAENATASSSDTDDEDSDNQGVQILDTVTDDGGELRIKLEDATSVTSITTGQISATLQLQEDADSAISSDAADISNTGYVTLYSTGGTSSSNYHGDIIFSSGAVKYRDSLGDQYTIDGLSYTEGVAIDFIATWTETTYSFSIDGGDTFYGPYDSREATAVSVISFKLGDTDGQSTDEFLVDDIEIQSDDTTEGSVVFSDDLEDAAVDDELDGTNDDYNSSSSEATVQLVTFG